MERMKTAVNRLKVENVESNNAYLSLTAKNCDECWGGGEKQQCFVIYQQIHLFLHSSTDGSLLLQTPFL